MSVHSELQAHLDQASPTETLDVIVILEPATVTSDLAPIDPADIAGGRKAFARRATEVLTRLIDEASDHTGHPVSDVTIFEHLASARLRAPAELVTYLGTHPSVASVRFAESEGEKI